MRNIQTVSVLMMSSYLVIPTIEVYVRFCSKCTVTFKLNRSNELACVNSWHLSKFRISLFHCRGPTPKQTVFQTNASSTLHLPSSIHNQFRSTRISDARVIEHVLKSIRKHNFKCISETRADCTNKKNSNNKKINAVSWHMTFWEYEGIGKWIQLIANNRKGEQNHLWTGNWRIREWISCRIFVWSAEEWGLAKKLRNQILSKTKHSRSIHSRNESIMMKSKWKLIQSTNNFDMNLSLLFVFGLDPNETSAISFHSIAKMKMVKLNLVRLKRSGEKISGFIVFQRDVLLTLNGEEYTY